MTALVRSVNESAVPTGRLKGKLDKDMKPPAAILYALITTVELTVVPEVAVQVEVWTRGLAGLTFTTVTAVPAEGVPPRSSVTVQATAQYAYKDWNLAYLLEVLGWNNVSTSAVPLKVVDLVILKVASAVF